MKKVTPLALQCAAKITGRPVRFGLVAAAALFATSASAVIGPVGTEPLVTYESVPSELQLAEGCPRIDVFPDGRVVAKYPAIMQRAGEWVGQLSAEELFQLNALLAAPEMVAQKVADLKAQVLANESLSNAAGEVFDVSDGSVSRFTFATNDGLQVMEWSALRADAQEHDIAGLDAMAALEKMLMGMADRLQRVSSAGEPQ